MPDHLVLFHWEKKELRVWMTMMKQSEQLLTQMDSIVGTVRWDQQGINCQAFLPAWRGDVSPSWGHWQLVAGNRFSPKMQPWFSRWLSTVRTLAVLSGLHWWRKGHRKLGGSRQCWRRNWSWGRKGSTLVEAQHMHVPNSQVIKKSSK